MQSSLKAEMCHTLVTRLPFTPLSLAPAPALKYNGGILSGQPRPRLLFLLGDFPVSLFVHSTFVHFFWVPSGSVIVAVVDVSYAGSDLKLKLLLSCTLLCSVRLSVFFSFYYKLFPFARVLVSSFAARVCV